MNNRVTKTSTTKPWKWDPPFKWSYFEWTISDYLKMRPMIDTDPEGQRPTVSPIPSTPDSKNPSKEQSIIESILLGEDIGEMKIAKLVHDEIVNHPYESVDGGHRKRAIWDFINNKFSTHMSSCVGAKKFSQLTEEEREKFYAFRIRVIIYDGLSSRQRGILFRKTNTVTPVNFMEMLNSYGNTPIAKAVRYTVRVIAGNPHSLFSHYQREKVDKDTGDIQFQQIFENISFNNNRLKIEEAVARIFCIINKNAGLTTSSNEELEAMYEDSTLDAEKVEVLIAKVKKVLDFVLQVSLQRKTHLKRGVTYNEFVMLYRFYFHYNAKYGENAWSIDNSYQYFLDFFAAFDSFNPRNPDMNYACEIVKEDGNRVRHEAFRGYLGDHKTQEKIDRTIKWMEHYFDASSKDYFILKDKKRFFTVAEAESALIKSRFVDPIDGLPLTLDDAQADHILPHSKGGKTDPKNLLMIKSKYNRDKGSMTEEQMIAYLKANGLISDKDLTKKGPEKSV